MRYGESVSRVEAVFDTTDRAKEILDCLDIEADDVTVITRKASSDGKTENRINGRTVTLSSIKQIGAVLLDICGQNEYQFLSSVGNHLKVVDSYSTENVAAKRIEIASILSEIRKINAKLDEIKDGEERADNIDFLKRKLNEIDKIKTYDGELDELEEKRRVYRASGKIIEALNEAENNISGGSESIIGKLQNTIRAMSSVSDIGEEFFQLNERLKSTLIELEDISDAIDASLDNTDVTESDIDQLEDRLHKVRELIRKYGDYNGIKNKRDELADKINFLENADELFDELEAEKKNLLKKAYDIAVKLSDIRKATAKKLEVAVMRELGDLGMANAVFKVMFEDLPKPADCEDYFTSSGLDKVEFYLSPNAGQPLKPLTKIISGGEQSRLMLALKVISGNSDEIPSLVFDEIDTGISGKIGLEVAKKLAVLSRNHQVLCVTHLPQIAAMADKNFFIEKNTTNGETVTNVSELDRVSAVEEVARLSGGKDISQSARTNAEEMKNWSDKYKTELKK